MAEGSSLLSKEMKGFKVRLYTNIPPNAVLVGHNHFTKNAKIYSKALFHLPWFESRYISMQTQNMDLKKQKYEINGQGLEIISDAAISYKVKPFKAENGGRYGVAQRWKSFINSFNKRPASQFAKAAFIGAATIASAFFVGPFCMAIPALSAGYVTFFHQDPEYIKTQGIYKAAYESNVAKERLEQVVFDGLRVYYANHNYEQIKGKEVNLNDPEFAHLKRELDAVADEFGIEVTKINIQNADLTDKSNEILQKQREAEIEAERIKLTAVAKKEALKAEAEGLDTLIKTYRDRGFSSEDIARILSSRELGQGGNAVVLKNFDDNNDKSKGKH